MCEIVNMHISVLLCVNQTEQDSKTVMYEKM